MTGLERETSTYSHTGALDDWKSRIGRTGSLRLSSSAAKSIAGRHGPVLGTADIFATWGIECFGAGSMHHNAHTRGQPSVCVLETYEITNLFCGTDVGQMAVT